MLSIRTFTRSLPRAVTRISASAPKRQLPVAQTGLFAVSGRNTAAPRFAAAFSTSGARWEKEGEVDDELAAKLESELQLENQMRDSDERSPTIDDFLSTSGFSVEDIPGQQEVTLTKQFGNEKIIVTFTVADLNNFEQEEVDTYDDQALYDEDVPEDGQSGAANTKGAVNAGRTSGGNIKIAPEDSVAPADRPELTDDEAESDNDEPSFASRVSVVVEKAGKGALQLETVMQDGIVNIEEVYFLPKTELANAKTADQEWERSQLYTGPPFGNLDEDLQVLLERYLDERGVNTAMALFIPDYIDYKEQKEYVQWLSSVKSFVEA